MGMLSFQVTGNKKKINLLIKSAAQLYKSKDLYSYIQQT